MKHLFCTLLLLGSLTSCSDDEPTPASTPSLMGAKWTLQTSSSLATPQGGTPTTSLYPLREEVTMTFLTDTRFSVDVKASGQTGGRHFEGAYTYQAPLLTCPVIYSWKTSVTVPRTFRVAELSAHKLVLEDHWKNVDTGDGYYIPTDYVTTDTYTR